MKLSLNLSRSLVFRKRSGICWSLMKITKNRMDQNNSKSYVPYFLLRNKLLKFFALNILKNLPETLLSEELNLSTIITGGIPISKYRSCLDCNDEISSLNSSRSITILVMYIIKLVLKKRELKMER